MTAIPDRKLTVEGTPHICICVCTFKRPELLQMSLKALLHQVTQNQFTYSIVVADNDCHLSARRIVELLQRDNPGIIKYVVEPEQNIALARNKAIAHSNGDLLAFVDDDEIPTADWLFRMHAALSQYRVEGILGPVRPSFSTTPPDWVIKARLFERPIHHTGYILNWTQTRTGNVLIRRSVLKDVAIPFNRAFGSGGEDMDFFRRMIASGNTFIWCNDAAVYEIVPPSRWQPRFLFRRALLRGKNTLKHPISRAQDLSKSLIAVPLYALALPFLLLLGRHFFMRYLIKLLDHTGRLLAAFNLNPINERDM